MGSVDVLCSPACRAGLRLEVGVGDFAEAAVGGGGCVVVSVWRGGGASRDDGAGGAAGGGGEGAGAAGEDTEGAEAAALCSSLLGPSWGVCTKAVSAALSFSGCVVSVLVALAEVLVDLRPATDGEAAPEARAAASAACWRSFFRRLSSAPRLELRGRRAEGGERLAARLL